LKRILIEKQRYPDLFFTDSDLFFTVLPVTGDCVYKLKKTLGTILKGLVTITVIILLVRKLGWEEIASTILTARPFWLVAALAAFLLSAFLGVFQWSILLRNRGIELTFGRTCRLYFIGMFFNNFVLGGIVGDAMKVTSLQTRNRKGKAGLAATFLDRFAGLWAMCGFAVGGSCILLRNGALSDEKMAIAVISLFAAFVLFIGILVFLMARPVQKVVFFLVDSVSISGKKRVRSVLSEMLIDAHDTHILFKVALLSTVIQLLRIGVHILSAHSLGLLTGNNFHFFFIFVPIIAMLMTLPLPFGVKEAAGGILFSLAGFPTGAAYVMGFLASLVGLAASFIGGLFYILDHTFIKETHENNISRHPAS
jgi:uncharacterized protein (TIRG00374 family)